MDCLALADTARSGFENMERDQQMLEYASENETVLMRVYEWSEPTLSLGYFQPLADRQSHHESSCLPCVRRSTGGGAIVHHHDLTYSIAVPPSVMQGSIGAAQPLYDAIHDAMVEWLRDMGLEAAKWSTPTCRSDKCSFLCFERRSFGDVIVGDSKIMGSAQRRLRGALLQHGSLLLKQSPHAPSLRGLAELKTWDNSTGSIYNAATDTESPCCKKTMLQRLAGPAMSPMQTKLHVVDAFPKEVENYPKGNYRDEKWVRKR